MQAAALGTCWVPPCSSGMSPAALSETKRQLRSDQHAQSKDVFPYTKGAQ